MAIQLIDVVTPDVGLKPVAEKLNANFTASENAASRLVQSSPTDATAGRLMPVGAFGLGGDPILLDSGDDLNALSANTKFIEWTSGSVPTNAPSANCQGFTIEESAGSRGYQRVHDRSTKISYERSKFGGTWSAWQPFYTGANLVHAQNVSGGTVLASSQTAGVNLIPAQSGNWKPATDTVNNGYNIWVKQ